ncbi:rhodanese-like domain-containing protein [Rhodospirillaceae bacterium SYSU D60014]|uniref:rhodanese-like domain-containing protein n=1 Tax=Virgifigura deserti TaxID=2268457 RepID=UPI000E668AAB
MPDSLPPELTVADLADLRRQNQRVTIVDVREGWEWEICRISGSLHMPLDHLTGEARMLPKDEPLVVLCHHGMRSQQATAWLRRNGYDNAVNLSGGIDAWARQVEPSMQRY